MIAKGLRPRTGLVLIEGLGKQTTLFLGHHPIWHRPNQSPAPRSCYSLSMQYYIYSLFISHYSYSLFIPYYSYSRFIQYYSYSLSIPYYS